VEVRRVLLALLLAACGSKSSTEPPPAMTVPAHQTIKVAVIGGMMQTGFWPEVAARFERATGHKIELIASGPKPVVIAAFKKGGIDLITVHASDAMVNLVADGLARDPQPWVRNDLVIVGPTADPAHIKGEKDVVEALKKIIAAKAPLLVNATLGADGVLHDLLEDNQLELDPTATVRFVGEDQHSILSHARQQGAYTMIGRIPFIMGKLKANGIEIMVRGDPRLRRPYLVEVSTTANPAAQVLADYLRSPETQAFIASYGIGTYDDGPLFFPISVKGEAKSEDRSKPQEAATQLKLEVTIAGARSTWGAEAFAKAAKFPSVNNSGEARDAWSLRELVRANVGPTARVVSVTGADGTKPVDEAAWNNPDQTPVVHATRRGSFKFRWADKAGTWGEAEVKDVTAIEIVR
jgi:tungstate transport system substrate-binding protein